MSVTLALSFITLQDIVGSDRYTFSVFPEFLFTFGMVLMLLSMSRSRIVQAALPLILSMYLLAAFYIVGEITGRRDLVGSPASRQMPCAFLDEMTDCFDLLLLGSEAAVLRKNGRITLVKRDRVRLVQSRAENSLLAPAPGSPSR
jgi:hypothetical protein